VGALSVPVNAQKTLLGCDFIRRSSVARLHYQGKPEPRGVHLSPSWRPLVREDENGFGQALVLFGRRGRGGGLPGAEELSSAPPPLRSLKPTMRQQVCSIKAVILVSLAVHETAASAALS
jgi:hypothetical protein